MKLDLTDVSETFQGMLTGISEVESRDEIVLIQIPSPKGIAPEAIAISAEVAHETA